MSHGHIPRSAHIANDLEGWMDELGLPHYTILDDLLDEHEKEWSDIPEILGLTPICAVDQPIVDAYKNLQTAFEQATGFGIEIESELEDCNYNGEACFSRKTYWNLTTGVIQLTPAAEKYQDKFHEKSWVYFNH